MRVATAQHLVVSPALEHCPSRLDRRLTQIALLVAVVAWLSGLVKQKRALLGSNSPRNSQAEASKRRSAAVRAGVMVISIAGSAPLVLQLLEGSGRRSALRNDRIFCSSEAVRSQLVSPSGLCSHSFRVVTTHHPLGKRRR